MHIHTVSPSITNATPILHVAGTAIGKGVYFAVNAQYSAGSFTFPQPGTNHRHIYQARVLTGMTTRGNSQMIDAPPQDPTKPNDLYNSVSDNPASPNMFVVFSDTQAYPEYLITFV